MTPTEMTSIEKTAAVRGEPKMAAKAALMPVMMRTLWSFSLNLRSRETVEPRLAPICRAAPSRPTEAPKRCEMALETKMRGIIRKGISSPPFTAARTMLVPLFSAVWGFLSKK